MDTSKQELEELEEKISTFEPDSLWEVFQKWYMKFELWQLQGKVESGQENLKAMENKLANIARAEAIEEDNISRLTHKFIIFRE